MKIIVNLFFLIIFLISCTPEVKQDPMEGQVERDEILASFMQKNYDTYEGTRMQLFLHAVVADKTGLSFEVIGGPEWITISSEGTKAKIFIDAPSGAEGKYIINIAIKQAERRTNRIFELNVENSFKEAIYVDALNGKNANDGSIDHPLATMPDLSAMEDSMQFLCVIFSSGTYEALNIQNKPTDLRLLIMPSLGSEVTFEGLYVNSCAYVHIKSCNFVENKENSSQVSTIFIGKDALSIELENNHIQTSQFTENWTYDEWRSKAKSGVFNYGNEIRIHNNLIDYVFHGIENNGSHFYFYHNIIDRFSGDAIRNTGSSSQFFRNMLKNALISDYSAPDGNHDDLYQSWTFDLPISNVTLSHNIAIDIAEENLKLAADTVQGFACFDGFVESWKIKNNLILLDHPHGIALFGADGCTIENNIVARNPFKRHVFESEPWIMINNHKDGRPSFGNIVKNNLTTALIINDTTAIQENNVVMDTLYKQYFENYSAWNFNKKETKDNE